MFAPVLSFSFITKVSGTCTNVYIHYYYPQSCRGIYIYIYITLYNYNGTLKYIYVVGFYFFFLNELVGFSKVYIIIVVID